MSVPDLINMLINDSGTLWGIIFSGKEIWAQTHTIADFYNVYLPWVNEPDIYSTTFEKLVGTQGGGNLDIQLNEIIGIAKHMGKDITLKEAKNISDNLFGKFSTFREGKIGSWKEHFTEEQKIAFKKAAGQLLIDLGYEKDFDW